jgi:hypothetical protein
MTNSRSALDSGQTSAVSSHLQHILPLSFTPCFLHFSLLAFFHLFIFYLFLFFKTGTNKEGASLCYTQIKTFQECSFRSWPTHKSQSSFSRRSSAPSFQSYSSLLGPNVSLGLLYSNAWNLCPSIRIETTFHSHTEQLYKLQYYTLLTSSIGIQVSVQFNRINCSINSYQLPTLIYFSFHRFYLQCHLIISCSTAPVGPGLR